MKNELEQKLYDIIFDNEGTFEVTWHSIENYDWEAYREASRTKSVDLVDFKHGVPVVEDRMDAIESPNHFREMLEASGDHGVIIPGVGQAFYGDSYGGEGDGDQYWYVFKLVTHNGVFDPESHYPVKYEKRFFKVDGYYSSYDGSSYDELYEVFPKQVMKTEWTQASEDVS